MFRIWVLKVTVNRSFSLSLIDYSDPQLPLQKRPIHRFYCIDMSSLLLCTGLIINNENTMPRKYFKFDEMDKSRGTIFGVPVTIFLAVSPDPSVIGRLVDLQDASYKMGSPLYASSLSIDRDKMDDAFTDPSSLYLIAHYILLAMVLMGALDNGRVMVQYYSIRDGVIPLNYCTFSLVTTAVANVFRIARAIDVVGVSERDVFSKVDLLSSECSNDDQC